LGQAGRVRLRLYIVGEYDNINYEMDISCVLRKQRPAVEFLCQSADDRVFRSKTARKSAVGRIVYKLLIYDRYATLRGRCYEAKKCFFAADRGMRRGQPWSSGQRCDTAGAVSAVRGSGGADSAMRHRPGRRYFGSAPRLAQGILSTSCTAFEVSGQSLTRCLGRRRAPSGSVLKASASRSSS
jgi:hypothetical protein